MPEEKPQEEAAQEQDTGTPAKPGKKKMLVRLGVIALAVVVLAGGGFFAYQKFFAKGAKGDKAKSKQAGEKSALAPMDPFILNLSDPGRFLKLSMQLEVDDQADVPMIEGNKPQIKDAVITLISSKSVDDLSTAEGKMQLKDDLVLRVNQVVGKPVVKNIYFTEFIMQ